MANRIANLLGNTKTRTMVLVVLGFLIFGVVIAVSQTEGKGKTGPDTPAPSKTTGVPNQVKSTPGSDVTRKYQELQEKANVRGAQEAAKKGTTFIPTLTGNVSGYSDTDFEKQLTAAYGDVGGKCSSTEVADLKKKGMETTAIILQLKSEGCTAAQIGALFSTDQIAAALLAEKACNANGCGSDAVAQMKKQGFDDGKVVTELKKNGCATNDIVTALKASGMTAEQITAALKASGTSANDIAVALKQNGFTAEQIAKAMAKSGFTADQVAAAMAKAGYPPDQIAAAMSKAGYSKNDIIGALTKAGFSSVDIAKAISDLNLAQAGAAAQTAQQAEQAAAAARLSSQQEAQQLAAYSQQRQGKIQELVTAMDTERKTAMDVWTQIPPQQFAQGEWAQKKAQEAAEAAKAGYTIGKDGKATKKDAKDAKVILKAGSILFAVLDTAVDTDEPGPVMATIVAGSLKGSKLLGTMSSNLTSETISLSFTAINMPGEANSMGISAVAIDPDTARTALASDVDHHYLYRWGSLLASSFIQGYATAVASSGSTSTTSQGAAGVTTTTSSPAQNSKQQLWSGIAQVGQKWSQAVGENYNRPITVTIEQGTGLGILVTSDLVYGTNPTFYTPPSSAGTTAPPGTATTAGAGGAGGAAAANVPGGLGNSGTLTADQRQALWNILQNQPVTTQTAGSSTVSTTSTMGGTPP
ncbi:MAG TPA: TrbI/VirB10 family protein [Gammaproteobacteria bacterium]|nr:TrbI/VirB10 family protein [Gammaproteobacteria bacterium]